MKTETSLQSSNYLYNTKPEIIDDFWTDCIDQKDKKYSKANSNSIKSPYSKKSSDKLIENNGYINNKNSLKKNKNSMKSKYLNESKKNYSNINILHTSQNRNKNNEKYLINIYNKHPSFAEEVKNEEIKKLKYKKALNRCLGLYKYGKELQKNLEMNKENNERQRKKNDISLCTFKPKINKKILFLNDKNVINNTQKQNRLYNDYKQSQKQKIKSMENARNKSLIKDEEFKECTFKPKFVREPSQIEKIIINRRKNAKSISNKKENEDFILRYIKARDEYLIKRFKKLNRKDDSYDNSLISLTKRLCNKQYKNYLNVNNTILLFGETISTNNFINSSIADFRGLTIANTAPEKKKQKINYIIGLRKNLHDIDLNDSDNEQ